MDSPERVQGRKRGWAKSWVLDVVLSVAVIAALLLLSSPLPVCRDWAYICENTGSRKGYREWFFGTRTGAWYTPSALETFMRARYPEQLEHRWTSCAGTGRNIFGQAVLCGHGDPGPIIHINRDSLDDYVRDLPDIEKKNLYDLFKSGNVKEIAALEPKMLDWLRKHILEEAPADPKP